MRIRLVEKENKKYYTKLEAKRAYKDYLRGHIQNVQDVLELIIENMPDNKFIQDNKDKLRKICENHDKSKYEKEEYIPYLHHFYPTCKEDEEDEVAFEEACKHHVYNNKHHWEYWLDKNSRTSKKLNIPNKEEYMLYCVERVCDWCAMAAQHKEAKDRYYKSNKDSIILSAEGRKFMEEMLDAIPDDFAKNLSFKKTRGKGDK